MYNVYYLMYHIIHYTIHYAIYIIFIHIWKKYEITHLLYYNSFRCVYCISIQYISFVNSTYNVYDSISASVLYTILYFVQYCTMIAQYAVV